MSSFAETEPSPPDYARFPYIMPLVVVDRFVYEWRWPSSCSLTFTAQAC